MSWITIREAKDASKYRTITFEGGRILQARELNDWQATGDLREKNAADAVLVEGALANVASEISGGNLVLSRADAALADMKVYFNGGWEPLPDTSLALPATKASGTDVLYLHWVMWRVTMDGTYQEHDGCLVDGTLKDTDTNEPVAERGQIQFVLSFDAALSAEVKDDVTMIAKSSAGVPVGAITWTASVPSFAAYQVFRAHLQWTTAKLGVLKINSDGAGGVAVGVNDPRLTDQRTPKDLSVYTGKVTDPEPTGNTTAEGLPEVRTGVTDGGVSSAKIWYLGLRAKLSDVVAYILNQIASLLAALAALALRVTALENKQPPTIDLSFHVGKPLGKASNGGQTHVPEVTDPDDGFRHNGSGASGTLGNEKYAYAARTSAGTALGALLHDGDYKILNPAFLQKPAVAALPNGVDVRRYSDLANYLLSEIANLKAAASQPLPVASNYFQGWIMNVRSVPGAGGVAILVAQGLLPSGTKLGRYYASTDLAPRLPGALVMLQKSPDMSGLRIEYIRPSLENGFMIGVTVNGQPPSNPMDWLFSVEVSLA